MGYDSPLLQRDWVKGRHQSEGRGQQAGEPTPGSGFGLKYESRPGLTRGMCPAECCDHDKKATEEEGKELGPQSQTEAAAQSCCVTFNLPFNLSDSVSSSKTRE